MAPRSRPRPFPPRVAALAIPTLAVPTLAVPIFAALGLAGLAGAQTAPPVLIARDNNAGPAYNLPNGASVSSSSVAINASGAWAVKYISAAEGAAIAVNGASVYSSPTNYPSDAQIGDNGLSAFSNGIAVWGSRNGGPAEVLTFGPAGTSDYGAVRLASSGGYVGYLATVGGNRTILGYDPATATDAVLAGQGAGQFLYSGFGINRARSVAYKLQTDSAANANELRLLSGGTVRTILRDRASLPASPYASFGNSFALGEDGRVAVVANLVGGGSALVLTDGATTTTLATTATDVGAFESFEPKIGRDGGVYFRARGKDGLFGIYAAGPNVPGGVRRIVAQNDVLATPLGDLTLRLSSATSSPFSGNLALASDGTLAFSAATYAGATYTGFGVFAVRATPVPEPATLAVLGLGALALLRRRRA